jgi:hypothetical protein
MQRLKRRLFGLVLLIGVLAGLARLALASEFAAREAVARIGAAVGAPVNAKDVTLGFSASALRGVQVFEVAASADAPAWSAVGAVDADLSIWQLLTNDLSGGTVTLRDVAVTLAFDADNKLVTRLPVPPAEPMTPLPLVRVEGGTFTLRRAGFPDETFHNIRLELRTEGEKQTLSGTIDDPFWGRWDVSGGCASAAEPFALVLKTAREVRATMPLLRRAPFCPPSTWRAVECEGETTCEVTLRFVPGDRVKYKVDLHPHDTKVYVPSIDLRAEAALGQVVIEDDVLTLKGVHGQSSGGEVRVNSTMDFRGDDHVLRFAVETSAINPRLLPESWRVPAVQGSVEGKADLELRLHDGWLVGTRGQGRGTLKAFPFLRPITLYLESDGKGFRFGLGRG